MAICWIAGMANCWAMPSAMAEGEKVRAQAMAEGMAQQFAIPAIQQMAKIQDLRGKYF